MVFSGGHGSKAQAARTNEAVLAFREEEQANPDGPKALAIDLNADDTDVPAVVEMLKDQNWIDLGAHAHIWNREPREFTCVTSNCKKPTRRDYLFVNRAFFQLVMDFQVIHDNGVPTHSTLQVILDSSKLEQLDRQVHKPLSLFQVLRNYSVFVWLCWVGTNTLVS